MKLFTFVELPKSVQFDQGSFFIPGIFQQVMYELGIKQYKTSAYHPESLCALERFHQAFKDMISSYCFETEIDEIKVNFCFYMYLLSEYLQKTLGFSQFHLVFGIPLELELGA